jgi:hypothetical protein
MTRIKEISFFLNGNEFQLTYFKNENPKLFKDGIEFNSNKSEILRNYIIELGLGNTLFKNQTTQQLSSFILNHFSDKSIKNKVQVKSISSRKKHIKNKNSQNHLDQKKLILSENFIVVIICSKKKKKSNFDGYPEIKFKAVTNKINEFHPDDFIPNSEVKWRKYLEEHQNDKSLLSAFDLYSRKEYRSLYEKFHKSLYILSAGWGLVNSEFKLPNYDITFSSTGEPGTKRKTNDLNAYQDFNQMSLNENEDIIFIGSVNYLPLFYKLTQDLNNRKLIFFFGQGNNLPKSKININTFVYKKFHSSKNRSWYYELAKNIADGIIP